MQCFAGNAGAKSSMSISEAQQSRMIETHMIVSSCHGFRQKLSGKSTVGVIICACEATTSLRSGDPGGRHCYGMDNMATELQTIAAGKLRTNLPWISLTAAII